MTRLNSGILLASILSFSGCAHAPYTVANSSHGQGVGADCQKQSAPVESSNLARPTLANGDGPCNGSSDAAQIQQQKRSEQSRFEREYEYMDEG